MKAADAYIDDEYQLVSEVFGDEVNLDALIQEIKQGIMTGLKLDYKLEDYYIQPVFTKESKEIVRVVKEIDAYKNMKIRAIYNLRTEDFIIMRFPPHLYQIWQSVSY